MVVNDTLTNQFIPTIIQKRIDINPFNDYSLLLFGAKYGKNDKTIAN